MVFETHSTSEDNERGRATGWLPGRLSEQGRRQARDLGLRRRHDRIAAVFSSDLGRAVETATIAFGDSAIPVLHDWRLRECDYGRRNGMPAAEMHAHRRDHLDRPYRGGESWRQAVARAARHAASQRGPVRRRIYRTERPGPRLSRSRRPRRPACSREPRWW